MESVAGQERTKMAVLSSVRSSRRQKEPSRRHAWPGPALGLVQRPSKVLELASGRGLGLPPCLWSAWKRAALTPEASPADASPQVPRHPAAGVPLPPEARFTEPGSEVEICLQKGRRGVLWGQRRHL